MLGLFGKDENWLMTVHDINPNFQLGTWPTFGPRPGSEGRVSFESCHRAKDGRLIPIDVNVNFVHYNGSNAILPLCGILPNANQPRAPCEPVKSGSTLPLRPPTTACGTGDGRMRCTTARGGFRLLGYPSEEVLPTRAFF